MVKEEQSVQKPNQEQNQSDMQGLPSNLHFSNIGYTLYNYITRE